MNAMINPYAWAGISCKPIRRNSSPEEIIDTICDKWGISYYGICTHTRKRNIVEARQTAWYIIKQLHPKITYLRIGETFGGFHHTTVMHGVQITQNIYDTEPEYKALIDELITHFKGYKNEYPINTYSQDIKTVAAPSKYGIIRVARLGG